MRLRRPLSDRSTSAPATRPGPGPGDGVLSPATRRAALDALDGTVVDVLVIGGGITGAGVALDAASRGLDVVLVERDDLASGTSSRSSKLVHGGLRYLEHLDVRLVFEALHERSAMVRDLAPGLVTPVPFLLPVTGPRWQRAYLGAGVALYDVLASVRGGNPLPRHRHLGRRRTRAMFPGLDRRVVRGGIAFWDAQMDDARHTMLVARTAAAHGARICTATEVVVLLRDGDRVVGATLRDRDDGRARTVRARAVINATGIHTDAVEHLAGAAGVSMRASKGIHLVVPRDRIDLDAGLVLRTEKSVLFVIPWLGRWLIGTTDTPEDDLDAEPVADRDDVAYVLDRVNAVLARPLHRDDVTGVFAGLRPLVPAASPRRRAHAAPDDTATLRREHVVHAAAPGLVSITGGKYTTYRRMAADAVDAALGGSAALRARATSTSSRTRTISLLGAHVDDQVPPAPAASPLERGRRELLVRQHGPLVAELDALLARDPALARPLAAAPELLRVEIVHAVTHEGARHLVDVMTRRTRLALVDRERARAAAPEIAATMAPHLGWRDEDLARELDAWHAWLARDTAALDDAPAAAVR